MAINIVYLDHTSSISGAEISLLSCLTKLDEQEYSPLIVCPPDGPLIDKSKQKGIKVETARLPYLTYTGNPLTLFLSFFYILISSFHLMSLIKNNDIQLVHANSIRAGILGAIAARLTKTPIIWHIRDFLPKSLLGKTIRYISGIIPIRIIAISEAVKKDFSISPKQEAKTVVIYDGVDLDKYNPSSIDTRRVKQELNLSNAFPVVGIIGQIIDWKGQKEFIQAASQIADSYPKARFLVVGEALFREKDTVRYKQELIDLVDQLGISQKVVFTGFREDIPELLSILDILVLASWNEPLGMVQLEAMAMSKPIVATKSGGPQEIIEDGYNGILVPPKDPQSIADAVIALVKNDRLSYMGKAGSKQIEQKFNLVSHLQQVEDLYEEILCKQ